MSETLILWLPIPVLVGVFLLGFGLAWWLRAEDARQLKARCRDDAAVIQNSYDQISELVEENDTLRMGWQAVRAAVEQHSVAK